MQRDERPVGSEPAVRWLNGFGFPRSDWQDRLDPAGHTHADDAIWPVRPAKPGVLPAARLESQ